MMRLVKFSIADGGEKKLGRIVEINEDHAVIQVFESTAQMSLLNTHTRLTGHPMELGLSEELWDVPLTGLADRSMVLVRSRQRSTGMSTVSR